MAERWMPARFAVDRGLVAEGHGEALERGADPVAVLEALGASVAEPPSSVFLDTLEERLMRSHLGGAARPHSHDHRSRPARRPWSLTSRVERPVARAELAEHLST